MRKYAESSIFSDATGPDGKAVIVEVKSMSNPNKVYRVDLTNGRCSCPAWKFVKKGSTERRPCKHLRALGYVATSAPTPIDLKEPSNKAPVVPSMNEEVL